MSASSTTPSGPWAAAHALPPAEAAELPEAAIRGELEERGFAVLGGVLEGLELITELVQKAGDRIIIMPGCGITPRNVRRIVEAARPPEIHVVGVEARDGSHTQAEVVAAVVVEVSQGTDVQGGGRKHLDVLGADAHHL